MVELSPGSVVSIVTPTPVVQYSSPGIVQSLWLKEGPAGPPGADGEVTTAAMTAAISAYAQPLDSDLTAIAALSTTSYGRAFLALANQAALMALLSAASETEQGKIEIATQTETNTGTDDVRAVTPLKLQTRLAAYAQPLDSDLTAIAALTTTSYGRAFLALADAAAARTALALGTAATVNTGTASGNIPLLSTGGLLPIARIASGTPDGTKFVRDDGTLVTPSTGSGGASLLSRVVRNPASATTYTSSSSSPTDVDATNLAATFTVPASGKVRVCLGGYAVSAGGTFYWSLRSGTTDVAGTERYVTGGYAAYVAVQDIVVTGLTPGASVTYKWAFRRASGSSLILCGGTEFSSTSYNGPAIMEVWSEA